MVGGPAVTPGVPGQTYTKTSLVASNVPTSMTHKQAQEAIIACGNNVPLLVQRNVSQPPTPAWKPQV